MVVTLLKRKMTATISARTMWRDNSGVKLKKTPTANPAARLLSSESAAIASRSFFRIFPQPSTEPPARRLRSRRRGSDGRSGRSRVDQPQADRAVPAEKRPLGGKQDVQGAARPRRPHRTVKSNRLQAPAVPGKLGFQVPPLPPEEGMFFQADVAGEQHRLLAPPPQRTHPGLLLPDGPA